MTDVRDRLERYMKARQFDVLGVYASLLTIFGWALILISALVPLLVLLTDKDLGLLGVPLWMFSFMLAVFGITMLINGQMILLFIDMREELHEHTRLLKRIHNNALTDKNE